MALKLVELAHAQANAGKPALARQALDRALHASSTAKIVFWAARTYAQLRDDAAVAKLPRTANPATTQGSRMPRDASTARV
jgi:hypothetical protein